MVRLLWFAVVVAVLPSLPSLTAQTDSGLASVYADGLAGKKTASGEPYDPAGFTAAHPSLRFGIRLAVTNPANGKGVTVTVNDRGPAVEGRILDLSRAAADALGLSGVAPVTVRVLLPGEEGPFAVTPTPCWFQLGAFRTETNARTMLRSLTAQGLRPKVRKDKDLFRIYLEVTEDQAAAQAAALAAHGWKGFLQLSREPGGELVNLGL
jgi:rare lipoprotein A